MKQKTHKPCKVCGKEFKLSRTTDRYCSSECMYSDKKEKPLKPFKSINKVSKKQAVLNAKYTVLRIEYLGKPENKICPITQQNAIEIHHTYSGKDRSKYFLDTTTWIAVSRNGHNWIHSNPKEARELGYLK